MILFIKIVTSALLFGVINLLAVRHPALSGYIAVLPVITFLSLITLMVDKQSPENISVFLTSALTGVLFTCLILLGMLLLLRADVPILHTIMLGLSAWALAIYALPKLFTH